MILVLGIGGGALGRLIPCTIFYATIIDVSTCRNCFVVPEAGNLSVKAITFVEYCGDGPIVIE